MREEEPEISEEERQSIRRYFETEIENVRVSPDFNERLLAQAEGLSASRRRGFNWGMPTWVQLWTPALTVGALVVLVFTFWRAGPFAPKQEHYPSETGYSETKGVSSQQASEKTLYALLQKGERAWDSGDKSQAVAAYLEAVNLIALPLNQLAWLAYEQGRATNNQDEMTKGLAWARLAVQLRPEKAAYLNTLAVILCTVGEREEAIRTMERAVQMEKDVQLQKKKSDKVARFRQGTCQ